MTNAVDPLRTGSRRPTFLCIGAGKAGTTWLWEMLRQHPDVFLPAEKEIHYFNEIAYEGSDVRNPHASKPLSWYLDKFSSARPDQVCGEVCPSYLWDTEAIERIHDFDPEMRILVILRDPVDRLFSSYLFGRQKGEIGPISFEEALEQVDYLLQRAPSSKFLERYLDRFGADRVKVLFHHDMIRSPARLLEEVESFIGVSPFVPSDAGDRRNVTGASRYPRATGLLMRGRIALKRHGMEPMVVAGKRIGVVWIFRWFQGQVTPYIERPTMDSATEDRLRRWFLEDVENLERLLEVDLVRWKPETSSPG